MFPTAETLVEKAAGCPAPPVARDVFWDGDTSGWYVVLTLVYPESPRKGQAYRDYSLAAVSGLDGDLRIFNGQVLPWPEALWASEVGQEVANQLGVPFYFPSPTHPETEWRCSDCLERYEDYQCSRYGVTTRISKTFGHTE